VYVLGTSQKLDLIKQIHGHAYNTWWTNVVSYDALCLCDCHTGQALDGAGWWIGELTEDRICPNLPGHAQLIVLTHPETS